MAGLNFDLPRKRYGVFKISFCSPHVPNWRKLGIDIQQFSPICNDTHLPSCFRALLAQFVADIGDPPHLASNSNTNVTGQDEGEVHVFPSLKHMNDNI